MKSFTYYLEKAIRPEWKEHYIDYSSLKSLLESFAQRRSALHSKNDTDINQDGDGVDVHRLYDEETIATAKATMKLHISDARKRGSILSTATGGEDSIAMDVCDTTSSMGMCTDMTISSRHIEMGDMEQQQQQSHTGKNEKRDRLLDSHHSFYSLGSTSSTTYEAMRRTLRQPIQSLGEIVLTKAEQRERYLDLIEREELCYILDSQIWKFGQLYKRQMDLLHQKLEEIIHRDRSGFYKVSAMTGSKSHDTTEQAAAASGDTCSSSSSSSASSSLNTPPPSKSLVQEYIELGDELLELYAFMGTNTITFRQILIRYDCLIRTLNGPPLGQWYIAQRRDNSFFRSIFSRRDLGTFVQRLDATLRHCCYDSTHYGRTYLDQTLHPKVRTMERTIDDAERAIDNALNERLTVTDNIVSWNMQYYFLAGSRLSELMLQPSYIRTRGAKLKKEIKYFSNWRVRGGSSNRRGHGGSSRGGGGGGTMSSTHPESISTSRMACTGENVTVANLKDSGSPSSSSSSFDEEFWKIFTPSLKLNFTSQLLYMMNHYIIEPSSTKYIHELGGQDALSGLLIGMASWAALISAFVYSIWSNKTFRQPLLCSAVFLTVGSFTYANALKFYSVPMAMIGRFLTGLGAPCGINYRLIADIVPSKHRTAVSAMFMTVSAMGMSLGPGTAVLLDFVDIDVDIPLYGRLKIDGMTGPGYLMSLLWLSYLFGLLFYFEDNERVGLQEIIDRTMSQETTSSTFSHHHLSHSSVNNTYHPPSPARPHVVKTMQSNSEDIVSQLPASPISTPSTRSYKSAKPTVGTIVTPTGIVQDPIVPQEHNVQRVLSHDSLDHFHHNSDNTLGSMDGNGKLNIEEEVSGTTGKTRKFEINQATLICMCLKFIGKFVLEVLGCSVSIITRHRYDWRVRNIGGLSFINGCLVIPISTAVGFFSHHYSDRTLLVSLLCVGCLGTLLLVDFTDFAGDSYGYDTYNVDMWASVGPKRYVAGIILEFCGFQAAQSVVLSILSKVVPLSLAKGTFNSGFLATSLTTLARANGDVFITVMGLISIRQLLNLLAIPSLTLTVFSIMLCLFYGRKLSV